MLLHRSKKLLARAHVIINCSLRTSGFLTPGATHYVPTVQAYSLRILTSQEMDEHPPLDDQVKAPLMKEQLWLRLF